MKRSEMQKYIADAIYCHIPGAGPKDLMVIAECVLQTIEGGNPSGEVMLPPITDLSHLKGLRDNTWDPE